jgi:EAL domain-containing protein (putative c-di-GMP-specific phosphodiesterase class I)
MAAGQFVLHHQPQVRLDDGAAMGSEALILPCARLTLDPSVTAHLVSASATRAGVFVRAIVALAAAMGVMGAAVRAAAVTVARGSLFGRPAPAGATPHTPFATHGVGGV